MASLQSLPTRGQNCKLFKEGWTVRALRDVLTLSLRNERLREGVGPNVAEMFGVVELFSNVVDTREGPAGQRTSRFSEISTILWRVVGLHANETVCHLGKQRAESHVEP